MNFHESFWLSGGANSFLSSLRRFLKKRGVCFVTRAEEGFDLALLNALSEGLTIERLRVLHKFGKPIIHRKVGYVVSGSIQMRAIKNGVVVGNKLQIEMSPYVTHSIFQSEYSYNTFVNQGFTGENSIIHNGVDTNIFNPYAQRGFFKKQESSLRKFWDGKDIFRLAIVTWSTDPAKGFYDYLQFDTALDRMPMVEIWFIGRKPQNLEFRNIRCFAACGHSRLATLLRRCHAFVQMAELETCSNAMLEAISCGLPVIYKNSGSAEEIAADFGVEYRGDPSASIAALQERYDRLVNRTLKNGYSINCVGENYLKVISNIINQNS
jgi:glycosyltransferase involved in cell wall biosynthesis